jgi:hypothetical protein
MVSIHSHTVSASFARLKTPGFQRGESVKDYYKIDLEIFMQHNRPLIAEIKSKAPVYADDMGMDEVQYINREIKRAHLEYIESLGVKDPYEYYITQHEEDRYLGDQLIAQHRKALHSSS